jgi:la-related protein 1
MQGSQAPSKTASGRTSTSHSRAHSPSSMASSPQHPGRGRQLPVDIRGAQAPEQQQQQLPQGNSPRAYADMALSPPVPYGQIARDVYAYGNVPSQPTSTQTYMPQQPPAPAQPQPPTHYPPALQLNTQQPYTSSSVSPYPQPYPLHTPSDRYGPAPTQPLPPGWATPEHYVYPYGYPPYAQPHPMMYWPSNLPLDMRQDGRAMYPSYPPVQPPQQIVPPPHVSEDDVAPSGGEEPATHPALPPPTMIARPPPPQESDAVAGYRAVKSILDARSGWEESTRGRRDVIFGSVGAPGGCESPSPSLHPPSEAQPAAIDSQPVNEKSERAVATFSIGVSPGEAGPSHVRSRTRSQPRLSRTEDLSDGKSSEPLVASDIKVIDLTSPETKWEFGTANRPQDEYTHDDNSRPGLNEPQSLSQAAPAPSKAAPLDVSLLFSGPLQESLLSIISTEAPLAELHHPYPQAHHHLSYVLPQHIHAAPPPPAQEELQVQTGPYPVHQPPPQPPSSSSTDGFEVKDFGYGFGRASGTGHGVASMREDRIVREREWERNRDPEREPYAWRPRRGSYGGHHERGGYNGRRGRGANGFGRGVSGRGFGRGGFGHRHQQRHNHQQQLQQQHQHQHQHQQQQHQHQQSQPQQQQQAQQQQVPPFTAIPPTQVFQPPPSPPPGPAADVGQYLPPAIQQQYMPHGFDAYQGPVPLSYPPPPNASMTSSVSVHPVPRPLSNITYSADPTRFFLLGQLEYYLSAQNMASDLFLRQRVIVIFYFYRLI